MLTDLLLAMSVMGASLCLISLAPQPSATSTAAYHAQLASALEESGRSIRQRDEQLVQLKADHKRELEKLTDEMSVLEKYQREASEWINWAQREIKNQRDRSTQDLKLRQELLNLRGDFSRVVFVIDISGSMGEMPKKDMLRPNWGEDGQPWTYVQNQVGSWLQNLPVDTFRIVCFNHSFIEHPTTEESWLTGNDGKQSATDFLATIQPNGTTNTELALSRALDLNPTAIILFTDGAPSSDTGELDLAQQQRIVTQLKGRSIPIPINVIAVSNYFNEELSSFLHAIASASGGGFVGL